MTRYEKTQRAIRSLTDQGHRPVDLIRAANQEHMASQIPALERAPTAEDNRSPRSTQPSCAAPEASAPIAIPKPPSGGPGRDFLDHLWTLWGDDIHIGCIKYDAPSTDRVRQSVDAIGEASDIFEKQMQLASAYCRLLDHVYGPEVDRMYNRIPLDGRDTPTKRKRGER